MIGTRKLLARATVVIALAWPGSVVAQFDDPPRPTAYALQNVTVVHADGRRDAGVTVVIRDGLIQAIGPAVQAPADAMVLDADSMYVYPGIVDAMGDADFEFPEPEDDDEDDVPSWDPSRQQQGFMPHRRVADYLTATAEDLADQRKKGIIAAAVHPRGSVMPGRGALLLFRKRAETPRELVLSDALGPVMNFDGAQGVYPATLFGVIAFHRQKFEDAKHLAAVHRAYRSDPSGMTSPSYDPDLAVLQEVMAGGRVFFEADLARDIRRALSLARENGFQPVIMGGDEAWKVAEELRAQNVPVLVSLDFPEPKRWKAEKEEEEEEAEETGETEPGAETSEETPSESPETTTEAEAPESAEPQEEEPEEEPDAGALREKQKLEDQYSNAGRLANAGVRFALVSEGGKAEILEGARKAIEYGLSEEDALRAITASPAELLGIGHLVRLRPGMPANLIVTDAPLFDEEAKIRYTMVEGYLEKGSEKKGGDEPPAADITGTWDVSVETDDGTFKLEMTVTQEGSDFEGSVSTPFGDGEVEEGVVSGTNVTFVIVLGTGGETMRVELEGTIEGDRASGSGSSEQGSFTWTARRTGGPEGR